MLTPVHTRPVHRKESERGFALLLVFLLAAGIALMLYQQMPRVAFESERDKEQLLIDRGQQYKRAIQEFYVAFKRYPASIEELEHTNDKRFLRKRYVDPYTGKDEWRLIHTNGMMLTDSLVTKPPAGPLDPNNPNKDQLASNLGAGGAGGASGVAGAPAMTGAGGQTVAGGLPPITIPGGAGVPGQPGAGAVNPAVLRRPSDRGATPGQFVGGAPGAYPDPNNPYAAVNSPDPNNPGQTSPGQPLPGQPAPGQAGQGQFPPGQFVPGQAAPGQSTPPQALPGQIALGQQNVPAQSTQPVFNPQQPDPFNNNSLPPADFPPISLQAMQQQQAGQANGQNPGQFPVQPNPGLPAGNQVRLGQNGQFIPVAPSGSGQQTGAQTFPGAAPFPGAQPGAQPFPGGQQFPGTQQFPGAQPGAQPFPNPQPGGQPFPGSQPTDPNFGQAGVAQGGAPNGAPGGGPNNAALNLINQLLTTPRQPPPGVSVGGNATPGSGGIAGVASKYEGASVKVYKDRKKFKEWEFVFDPNENAPKAPAQGNPLGNGTGSGSSTGNPAGGNAPGSTTPFGTAPSTSPAAPGTPTIGP
jgi:hypothetical protein